MRSDDHLYELAERLGRALLARRQLLATAESCTGGLVAGAITAVAGSSAWFERGFVTYTNDAKTEMLGVPKATLETFGAVSIQTAEGMSQGALAFSRAQWAVAVTGVAGPGGGSPEKPVGTVCLAWSGPFGVRSERRLLGGDRAEVRRESVRIALAGLVETLI
ncbi:MAG: CinA family protein [Casimicrobiaceae bacterium]